jgi:hypothetical protein
MDPVTSLRALVAGHPAEHLGAQRLAELSEDLHSSIMCHRAKPGIRAEG